MSHGNRYLAPRECRRLVFALSYSRLVYIGALKLCGCVLFFFLFSSPITLYFLFRVDLIKLLADAHSCQSGWSQWKREFTVAFTHSQGKIWSYFADIDLGWFLGIQTDYTKSFNSVVVLWIYEGDIKREACTIGFGRAFSFKSIRDTEEMQRLESRNFFLFFSGKTIQWNFW